MANIYRITRHKVEGDTIIFYHFDQDAHYVEGKGFTFTFIEKEWFRLRIAEDIRKEFSLSSNSRIYGGVPSCSERELMDYFRRGNIGRLISHRKYVNYDEDPYGRVYENGFYDYEIWDLTELFK